MAWLTISGNKNNLSVVESSLVLRSEVFLWTYLQDKHSGKISHIFLTITKKQVRGEIEQPKITV